MKLSEFDFDLPEALIATRPARPRSASRLLVATPKSITDAHAHDFTEYLRAGDLLVLNDTKVIPARLSGTRTRTAVDQTGVAKIEVTLLGPTEDGQWNALIKPLRKVREGEVISFSDSFSAILTAKDNGAAILRFNKAGVQFDQELQDTGAMPLPPYIASKRPADRQDFEDYQTVWAKNSGAVAAPTASLHFDNTLLENLRLKGVQFCYVTLHVGAGTFLPVKVDDIKDHVMHAERGEISDHAAAHINQTHQDGGRIIPVGTTALRLIETAAVKPGIVAPWQGATDIFIAPGYQFKIADALITNFHLPKSTLMMLVSALMGPDRVREIYRHAISHGYRFFSYGDASFLLPDTK